MLQPNYDSEHIHGDLLCNFFVVSGPAGCVQVRLYGACASASTTTTQPAVSGFPVLPYIRLGTVP